jgi:hypothetical protein
MTYPGLSMWNGSSKIHYFMDFWPSFCWRLWRLWMLLSTKFKGHKSNVRISGIYKYPHHNLKAVFSWPPRSSKWGKSIRKTLYMQKKICVLQKNVLSFGPNRTVEVRPNRTFGRSLGLRLTCSQ